jgi:beta-galactosidase
MHGQCVFQVASETKVPEGEVRLMPGDMNIGAEASGRKMLFSFPEGGLNSFRKEGGPETIVTPFRLSLFHAPTDTDFGNGHELDAAFWRAASLDSRVVDGKFAPPGQPFAVTYFYQLPIVKDAFAHITYQPLPDGAVKVKLELPAVPGMGPIPAVGLSLRMPKEFHKLTWYGLGPEENYIDRLAGARLGIFTTTAEKNLTPYVVPQELLLA